MSDQPKGRGDMAEQAAPAQYAAAGPVPEAPGGTAGEPDLSGLSSADVEARIAEGEINVNTELKTKSVRELVLENVCTLFNAINLVLAVLVIITGAWKNLTFLFIVFANTGIGIVQSLRSKKMVDKLTLLAMKKAVAIRDGAPVELELDQIVLGDLVRLGRGDQIPADAVVVSGDAHVNESLLTGESDPIHKVPGDELMSGSFLDSGMLYARVVHVGADNYVARINNEAKYVKKVNSEIMGALNAIVRFASAIMLPLGIALFASSVNEVYGASHPVGMGVWAWLVSGGDAWGQVSSSVLTTVGALLGMIPQGLVLLTSSVLAIATVRLARRKVLAQQLFCIETLARVDVLCLDKTGTITSGRMEVEGTYLARGGEAVPCALAPAVDSSELDAALAGIAQATSEDANETCQSILAHYEGSPGVTAPAGALERAIAFNSSRKYSGAVFERGAYVMGAAQFVLGKGALASYSASLARLASSCRVLVVARAQGFDGDGVLTGEAEPIGFVTIRDEIRTSAEETVAYFHEQGVTLNVISGDDPRTVSGIARTVGVPGAEAYVDATTLDTPAKLDAAVDRYHVFGRVTPQQKRDLVVALKRRGHTVAMTGDGVNDVLALKEADCSVAMAAGSDAARNVAEIVLVDNDFASMPAVVAEGRRSINNLQRSAALFLTKTLFSMGLAAICIGLPPYPFEPITMTLINFFCIGFPSFVLALEPNRSRVRGSFLGNVLKRALPAASGVLVACLLTMLAGPVLALTGNMLSTMCLVSTCAVGLTLIWRISWPFTPLRGALFAFVSAGILIGVAGFPEFFSIAALRPVPAVLTALFAAIGCLIFYRFADFLERSPERTTRLATGFGRGVRVTRRGRSSKVSSTGSSARRFLQGLRGNAERRQRGRSRVRAQMEAEAGLEAPRAQAGPRGELRQRGPAGRVEAGKGMAAAPVPRPRRRGGFEVRRSPDGIKVKIPKSKAASRKGHDGLGH